MKWFKKWLGGLILSLIESDETNPVIEVTGEKWRVVGVVGLRLQGVNKKGERLIEVGDVTDREKFVRIWAGFNGEMPRWSDGTPYQFF